MWIHFPTSPVRDWLKSTPRDLCGRIEQARAQHRSLRSRPWRQFVVMPYPHTGSVNPPRRDTYYLGSVFIHLLETDESTCPSFSLCQCQENYICTLIAIVGLSNAFFSDSGQSIRCHTKLLLFP
jgi:hypothetical protein